MSTDPTAVPDRLRTEVDVFDPALTSQIDRFNDVVAELAAIGPVVYSTAHNGHWVVTGYREIQEVMRDPSRFSARPTNIMPRGDEKTLPLELDPPEHTAYRSALQPIFSPTRMRALEPTIHQITTELIDGFAARGSAEFVSEFAHELPTRVYLGLMDLPMSDAPMLTEATNIFIQGKPELGREESGKVMTAVLNEMLTYFADVIADRKNRAAAGTGIISQIVHTLVTLMGVTRNFADAELCNMFFLLLLGGLHTVQGSLTWGLKQLAENPDQRQKLIADPDKLMPSAIEEILRIEGAISPGRRAIHDTVLGGVQIKADDQLLLILGAGNRDGREFTDPDELDIERSPNRHLSFGIGPHRCPGSNLARVELNIAFREIHRRIPDYRVDSNDPPIFHPSQVRGAVKMPISFTPEN